MSGVRLMTTYTNLSIAVEITAPGTSAIEIREIGTSADETDAHWSADDNHKDALEYSNGVSNKPRPATFLSN